jgi:ABC-type transport system involved in Fe-S cluster assembly, permease component
VIRLVASAAGRHVASHVVLDVGEAAGGSVVVYVENAPGVMHTAVVEGEARGAVEYVLVSRGAGPQYVHSALGVKSSLSARPFVIGGVMNAVREEYLIGEEASAEAVGLELGFGDSRIDHVVSMINDAPRGRGYARLYAVAADKSFVTQRAVGRIAPRGVGSDSAVEGVVYIAGEGAVANTQPVILVETGDVKGARHSAADAALDEEKEFLLRARGVRREDLPKLLVASLVDQYLASLSEASRGVVEALARSVLS